MVEHDRRKIRVNRAWRQTFLLQVVNIIIDMLSTFIFGFAVEIAAAIGNEFFIVARERFRVTLLSYLAKKAADLSRNLRV